MNNQTCFSIEINQWDLTNLPQIIIWGLFTTVLLLRRYRNYRDIEDSHFDQFDEIHFRASELADYVGRFLEAGLQIHPDVPITPDCVAGRIQNLYVFYHQLSTIVDELESVTNLCDQLDVVHNHQPHRNHQYRDMFRRDHASLETAMRAVVAAIRLLEPGLIGQHANTPLLALQWWENGFIDF